MRPVRLRVPFRNLRALAAELAEAVSYHFDDADWDAMAYGIRGTDAGTDRWWDYPLVGGRTALLSVAYDGPTSVAIVAAQVPEAVVCSVVASGTLYQHYDPSMPSLGLEGLVNEAFARSVPPSQERIVTCTQEHFVRCPECQEAQARFSRLDWRSLADTGVPWGYADAALITEAARAYFLPAYLIDALRTGNTTALAELLRLGIGGMGHLSCLVQRLIAFVLNTAPPS